MLIGKNTGQHFDYFLNKERFTLQSRRYLIKRERLIFVRHN